MNERQPSRSAGICIALMLALLAVAAINSPPAQCAAPAATPTVSVLATGLQGAFGSTVGPDGALYVAESAAGRISRINPRTGQITTFASGLPKTVPAVGVGGATDVAFMVTQYMSWSRSSVPMSAAVPSTAFTGWTVPIISP
jgi:streptogramin lyase